MNEIFSFFYFQGILEFQIFIQIGYILRLVDILGLSWYVVKIQGVLGIFEFLNNQVRNIFFRFCFFMLSQSIYCNFQFGWLNGFIFDKRELFVLFICKYFGILFELLNFSVQFYI